MKSVRYLLAVALLVGGCSKKAQETASNGSGAPATATTTGTTSTTGTTGTTGTTAGSGSGSATAAHMDEGPIPAYTPAADVPDEIKAAIAAPDRDDADRRMDAGRKPAETLAFFGIGAGSKVGELFAGGGYTTELMARVVGEQGHIWAQNTKEVMAMFARDPWTKRAAKPLMAVVTGVERPTEDPFPPEAKDLDVVITNINYHDFVNQQVDRAKLNAAIFAVLKKGGIYAIIDASAKAGTGVADTDTLHRIDEQVVKDEVTAAGFTLAAEGDFLRNPADTRDWSSSPKAAGAKRGTEDRFVLKFVKP